MAKFESSDNFDSGYNPEVEEDLSGIGGEGEYMVVTDPRVVELLDLRDAIHRANDTDSFREPGIINEEYVQPVDMPPVPLEDPIAQYRIREEQ
jgi:hypothetical protein